MSENNDNKKELLLVMLNENMTQCRHHESQRSLVTSSIIAIDSIIIGIITFDKVIQKNDLVLIFLLTILGIFGAAFSLKQYERYRFHSFRAKEYRNKLDELYCGGLLNELKNNADKIHLSKFGFLEKARIYYWWITLHVLIAIIGVVLFFIALK